MKMSNLNLLSALLLPTLFLSACGGGSEGDDTSNVNPPVVDQAPVSARDGFEVVKPNEPGFVDLTSLVDSGTDGVIITELRLESSQGSGQCGEASPDDPTFSQGFNVTIDGAAICQYSYEVESIAAEPQARVRARASVMVASSMTGSALLPPISVPLAINAAHVTNIETELGMDFPDGYTLSPDFSVLGDGDVTINTSEMKINYTATAEGVSRVVYVLERDIAGVSDIKMGTIDYAISDDLNNAPTAGSFTFAKEDKETEFELSTPYNIDVFNYIKDDIDTDALQLIAVTSYTADVNVDSQHADDLTNTVFSFQADSYGMHYVSYTVSDHRGGFATGIVEVMIPDPDTVNLWGDLEDGLLTFSAPLTRIEADALGITYQGFYADTHYYPAVDVTTFSRSGIDDYCQSIGGSTASTQNLKNLYANQNPAANWNWPTGQYYLGKQPGFSDKLISMQDGSQPVIATKNYYATCVKSGDIAVNTDKMTVTADPSEFATLTVNFKRDGEPVSGAGFMVEVTGSGVLNQTYVTTAADGTASVTVSNTIAETVNVSFTYATNQSDMIVASKNVDFIADVDAAQIDALQVLSDLSSNDGIDQNLLQVSVVDNGGNAIEGALVDVSLSGTTAQVFGEAGDLLTDENGLLIFGVTNTVAESVDVEVSLTSLDYGYSSLSVTSEFLDANTVITTPDTFTHDEAFAYCYDMSMRPATQSEYRFYLEQNNTLSEETYWETGEQRGVDKYPQFIVDTPSVDSGSTNDKLKGVMCVPSANSGLIGVAIDNGQSTFESLSGDTVANGVDTADFEVTLLDQYGFPAEGEKVYFAVSGAAELVSSEVITDANGVAQVKVTNTVTENVEVQAFYNGSLSQAAKFIPDESTASMDYSDFKTISNYAKADNVHTNIALFTLKNEFGTPIPGGTIKFSDKSGTTTFANSGVTDDAGQISLAVTNTDFTEVKIVASFNGDTKSTSMSFIDRYLDLGITLSPVDAIPKPADGSSQKKVRLLLTEFDASGKPISGLTNSVPVTLNGVALTVPKSGYIFASYTSNSYVKSVVAVVGSRSVSLDLIYLVIDRDFDGLMDNVDPEPDYASNSSFFGASSYTPQQWIDAVGTNDYGKYLISNGFIPQPDLNKYMIVKDSASTLISCPPNYSFLVNKVTCIKVGAKFSGGYHNYPQDTILTKEISQKEYELMLSPEARAIIFSTSSE